MIIKYFYPPPNCFTQLTSAQLVSKDFYKLMFTVLVLTRKWMLHRKLAQWKEDWECTFQGAVNIHQNSRRVTDIGYQLGLLLVVILSRVYGQHSKTGVQWLSLGTSQRDHHNYCPSTNNFLDSFPLSVSITFT